jgi:hypothetical protein
MAKIPIHCVKCHLLQIGKQDNNVTWDRGQIHRQIDEINFCEKFSDGDLPEKFSDCLNMPEICKDCDINHMCHMDKNSEPRIDQIAVQSCLDAIPISVSRRELIYIHELMEKVEKEIAGDPFTSSLKIAQDKINQLLKSA